MPVSSITEHWIKPDAVTINLNHFGDPDYLQVSVLAGAVVMAFKQDVIAYNAAHNYRTWPLQAANTYLETTSAYNVYARLTRSEVNASALIIYDPVLRDIEGSPISYADDGSEVLGEPDSTYFYIFLGQISESVDNNGNKKDREWLKIIQYGSLDSSEQKNNSGSLWEKLFKPHYEDPTDPEKLSWIEAKANMGIQGGVSMFIKGDNVYIPTIAEGLPFDNRTIWFNPSTNQIEVIGGTGGGVADSVAWQDVVGKPSWLLDDKISYSEIEGTPDLSVYALKSYVDDKLTKYVTLSGSQTISGTKIFSNGFKVGDETWIVQIVNGKLTLGKSSASISVDSKGNFETIGGATVNGNLLVKGGLTFYSTNGTATPFLIDATTLSGITSTSTTQVYTARAVTQIKTNLQNQIDSASDSADDANARLDEIKTALASITNSSTLADIRTALLTIKGKI